jgi:hypothetical protein
LARFGTACLLVVAAGAISIGGAAGSGSEGSQRLCTGGSKTASGALRARCDAEFVPTTLAVESVRPAAARAATGCPTYFVGQGQGKSPCEFLASYNIPGPTAYSASQVIGIVDAFDDPNITTELSTFDSLYGVVSLPLCGGGVTQSCFQKVNQNGATSPLPSSPPRNDDWKPEISLDVETAHAICPNCKILLVEANSDSFTNLGAAVNAAYAAGATEISNSYGLAESEMTASQAAAYDSPYANPVPMFVSAGDDGYGAAFPADYGGVISVGGTSLTTDSLGARSSESAWSGTGSGCSRFFQNPPWEVLATPSGTGCGDQRSISDVSADADPNTGLIIYTEGGWYQYGGTSLSSPMIAAMFALAANGTSAERPASLPYWNLNDFNDITSGSNGSCGGGRRCTAETGYDGPTGVGTPNGVSGFTPESTLPSITSASPTSGALNTYVTLTGPFIGDAFQVSFGSVSYGRFGTTFDRISATKLEAKIPANFEGPSGTFLVSTGDGNPVSSATVTVIQPPLLGTFSPHSGVEGSTVSVTGLNLTDATSVTLEGVTASFSNVTATTLSFIVPAGAQSGTFTVVTPGGVVTSSSSFLITPTITSFAPSSGATGSAINVTGTGLSGVTAAELGSTTAPVTVHSDTSATVTVPSTATSGTVSLLGPGGLATSIGTFTVTAPAPTITGFTPTSGVEGATVKVTGTNLSGASHVALNGTTASFSSVTSKSLNFIVPSGSTSGHIAVTTAGGAATSSGSFSITPTISSIGPTSGIVGSTFNVTGTGLLGVTAAKVGRVSAGLVVTSDTSVTVTVPSGASTAVVSLVGPGGTASSASKFTVIPPPAISSLSPKNAAEGATVTVTGTNMSGLSAVTLNGVSVPFSNVTSTGFKFTVPSNASSGHIGVTTPQGSTSSSGSLGIIPTIASFAPMSGIVGSTFNVTGTGFNGLLAATVNSKSSGFTVHSDTSVTITVPSGASTGMVSMTGPGGTTTSTTVFTVLPPPAVSSFSPTNGIEGATVTVSGTAFTGATVVTLGGDSVSFSVVSAKSLTFTVPSNARSGTVHVTTPQGSGTSSSSFGIIPTISLVSPNSGHVSSAFQITGTGFNGLTKVVLGSKKSLFSVNSDTSVTVTVPSGAKSAKVSLTRPGGTVSSSTSFSVNSARLAAAFLVRLAFDPWRSDPTGCSAG